MIATGRKAVTTKPPARLQDETATATAPGVPPGQPLPNSPTGYATAPEPPPSLCPSTFLKSQLAGCAPGRNPKRDPVQPVFSVTCSPNPLPTNQLPTPHTHTHTTPHSSCPCTHYSRAKPAIGPLLTACWGAPAHPPSTAETSPPHLGNRALSLHCAYSLHTNRSITSQPR